MSAPDLPTYTESWDASLSQTSSRGLWGEKGAFTSMRLDIQAGSRCAYFIEKHIERLCSTLKEMNISSPFEYPWIWKQSIIFLAGVAKHGNYMFRIMATDDSLSLTAYPRIDANFNITGHTWHHTRKNPELKTLDHQDILEAMEDVDRSSEELIIQSEDGMLLEGATSNLIFIRDNRLFVPGSNRLNGLTQQHLMPFLLTQYEVIEEDIPAKSLPSVDEIICCGSGKGVVSISNIPDQNWESKSNAIVKKTRFMYDSDLIDYRAAWRGP